jgi:hypothetical protein
LVEGGADVSLCRSVFRQLCERQRAGGAKPISNLRYFESAVMEAIRGRSATHTIATGAAEIERWRQRFRLYFEKRMWLTMWGRKPDEGNESREQQHYQRQLLDEFREQIEAIRKRI